MMKWKISAVFPVSIAAMLVVASAADQGWEIRGEFVAIEAGDPEMVVLRLGDGRTVKVPLDALSTAARDAARRSAAMSPAENGDSVVDGDGSVTVMGALGRSVLVTVPESIKDIEADAIRGRSAAEAADVYTLALAGGRLAGGRRIAAESRLREWGVLAETGVVRMGDRWVAPAEAQAATAESVKAVAHSLELMRLGNGELAEAELRKAARLDPESGRPYFVLGLSYAIVGKNAVKAVEHLADAVRREPANAAALNDLAVLEVLARRSTGAAARFREAIERAPDPSPVCDNLAWAVRLAGAARSSPSLAKNKLPEKLVEELNALYRMVTQDLKIKPAENLESPRFLCPDGSNCVAATLPEMAKQLAAAGPSLTLRRSLGFVIAPGRVVCPRDVLVAPDGTALEDVTIELPADRGRSIAATVVATPEDGHVALLMCDSLDIDPLPLARGAPAQHKIVAVDRAGDTWLDPRLQEVVGVVLTPPLEAQAAGRFIHSAVVPRGLGGGPIVDEKGTVVGLVSPTPRTDSSGNTAGFGVPITYVREKFAKFLPEDDANTPPKPNDRAISRTVIVVATRTRSASGAVPSAP